MISKDDLMSRNSLGYNWTKPSPRPAYRPSELNQGGATTRPGYVSQKSFSGDMPMNLPDRPEDTTGWYQDANKNWHPPAGNIKFDDPRYKNKGTNYYYGNELKPIEERDFLTPAEEAAMQADQYGGGWDEKTDDQWRRSAEKDDRHNMVYYEEHEDPETNMKAINFLNKLNAQDRPWEYTPPSRQTPEMKQAEEMYNIKKNLVSGSMYFGDRKGSKYDEYVKAHPEYEDTVWEYNRKNKGRGPLSELLNPGGGEEMSLWNGSQQIDPSTQRPAWAADVPKGGVSALREQDALERNQAGVPRSYLNQNADKFNFGDDYEALRPGFDRVNSEMTNLHQDRLNKATQEAQTAQDEEMASQGFTQKYISPEEEELANIYNSGGGDPYYGGTPNSRRRNTLQAPNDTSRIDPNYWVQPDYMDLGVPPGPNGQPRSMGRYSDEAQGFDNYWGRRR